VPRRAGIGPGLSRGCPLRVRERATWTVPAFGISYPEREGPSEASPGRRFRAGPAAKPADREGKSRGGSRSESAADRAGGAGVEQLDLLSGALPADRRGPRRCRRGDRVPWRLLPRRQVVLRRAPLGGARRALSERLLHRPDLRGGGSRHGPPPGCRCPSGAVSNRSPRGPPRPGSPPRIPAAGVSRLALPLPEPTTPDLIPDTLASRGDARLRRGPRCASSRGPGPATAGVRAPQRRHRETSESVRRTS
jgi:hypothetical protein